MTTRSGSYELTTRVYSRDGTKRGDIYPLTLRGGRSLFDPVPLVFTVNYDSGLDIVDDLAEWDIIEIYIRNKTLGIQDASGNPILLHTNILRLDPLRIFADDERNKYAEYSAFEASRHIMELRSVLWPSGTDLKSDFEADPLETVYKALIKWNTTSDATVANGRWREGDLNSGMGFNIAIATDQARGDNVSAAVYGDIVLDALNESWDRAKAVGNGGDWDLTWDSSTNVWTFEYFPTRLGDDKTSGAARVLFSLDNGTMSGPLYTQRSARATAAVAARDGEGATRNTSVVTGNDYASTNDIELFKDARQEKTAAGGAAAGDKALYKQRGKTTMTFDTVQTDDVFFSPVAVAGRLTYTIGDLVKADFVIEESRLIVGYNWEWTPSNAADPFQVWVDTVTV